MEGFSQKGLVGLHDRLAAHVERRDVPGLGTTWRTDPVGGLTGIPLTQRAPTSPEPPPPSADFWAGATAALT